MATLRCKEPFAVDVDGAPRVFTAGQLVDSSAPGVKGREHLFETVEEWMTRQYPVESVTAAPGEKRSVSTLGRRKGGKSDAKAADDEKSEGDGEE